MTETPSGPASARRLASKWPWVALVGSLALNLFVAGVVAASVWRAQHALIGQGGGFTANLVGYAQAVPSSRQGEIGQLLAAGRPALQSLHGQMRQDHERMTEALIAEPFDKERFEAALLRALESAIKFRQASVPLIAAVAGRLTLEERRAFLEQWRERRQKSPARFPEDAAEASAR